ncbi:MAG: MlaD family protein [Bryobacteraceae bacterium]
MAMVAMIILGVLIFLLTGSGDIFSASATLSTFLADSAAMASGAPVRLNGILIGDISGVALTGSNDSKKIVEIRMKIQKQFLAQIPDDSRVGIAASNLLGDKFLNITKGKSGKPITDGGTLMAAEAIDIPELMIKAADIMGSLQLMAKKLEVILTDIEGGRGNVGKLLKDEELYNRLNDTVSQANKMIAAVNSGHGTLGRLIYDESLYQEVRAPIQRINDLLVGLQQGQGTAGKLLKDTAVYDELRATVAEMRKLAADLNAGKGTAGKLLKDEALHKQINQIVGKLESSIDRINSGQGTLGQLLVNPQLYDSLGGATREMQALVKDIRANPKKFLRIKLAIF